LRTLGGGREIRREELETQVASVVAEAWAAFRAGETARAESTLGQVPEAEVFVVPPARSRAEIWRKGIRVAVVVFVLACALFGVLANTRQHKVPSKPITAVSQH
jgi:hypothetical protein